MDIGDKGHLELYRLKVEVLANSRVNGKIKQEVVASLGSIDALWLESFWMAAPAPEWRPVNWELWSLTNRTAFWQAVLGRMARVGDNRLSKDDRVAIRRAMHKVVPWVMEPERKRLAVLEAQRTYAEVKHMHEWAEKHVADDKRRIAQHTKSLRENEAESAKFASLMLEAGLEIEKAAKS